MYIDAFFVLTSVNAQANSCQDKNNSIDTKYFAYVKANPGNKLAEYRGGYVANQEALALFSGECASDPKAAAYIKDAEHSIEFLRLLCKQDGYGSDCGVAPTQASTNGMQADRGSNTGASKDNRRIYDGLVTDNCARYKPLNRTNSGLAWFAFENGCNETIHVHYNEAGAKHYFGSMMILKAGRSGKSWYSYEKYNGVNYIACKAKINGKDVHLDEKTKSCYYYK